MTAERAIESVDVYLRKMTLIVMIAMIASFCMRTFGTLFPQIFTYILAVKATILVHALFILSHLLFWLVFYREYISIKKASLKRVCSLAIVGSVLVSTVYLKKLSFVFGLNIQLPLFVASPYVDALVPLISAAFHLIFFMAFKTSLEPDEKPGLSRPILSIIIGSCIYIGLHLMVLFNFLATARFEWLEQMPGAVAVSTVPLMVAAVVLMLHFYYKFYCFLDPES